MQPAKTETSLISQKITVGPLPPASEFSAYEKTCKGAAERIMFSKVEDYLAYPATVEPNGEGGFIVTLRGWEGAMTEGKDYDDAMRMAHELVLDCVGFVLAEHKPIPHGIKAEPGDVLIRMTYDEALKMMLRNAMFEDRYRPADLAAALKVGRQKITSALNLRKTTSLNFLAQCCQAISRPLKLGL